MHDMMHPYEPGEYPIASLIPDEPGNEAKNTHKPIEFTCEV